MDETVLLDSDDFYMRYFRKPENYPEFTAWVSKFCFRMPKNQVADYVTSSNGASYTANYELSKEE